MCVRERKTFSVLLLAIPPIWLRGVARFAAAAPSLATSEEDLLSSKCGPNGGRAVARFREARRQPKRKHQKQQQQQKRLPATIRPATPHANDTLAGRYVTRPVASYQNPAKFTILHKINNRKCTQRRRGFVPICLFFFFFFLSLKLIASRTSIAAGGSWGAGAINERKIK